MVSFIMTKYISNKYNHKKYEKIHNYLKRFYFLASKIAVATTITQNKMVKNQPIPIIYQIH